MGTRLTIEDIRDKAEEIRELRGENSTYEFWACRNYGYRPGFMVRYGDKEKVFKNMRECLNWMEGFEVGIKEIQRLNGETK